MEWQTHAVSSLHLSVPILTTQEIHGSLVISHQTAFSFRTDISRMLAK